MSDEINIKTKSKKIKLFIIIAAVVIALLTIGAVIYATSKNATAKKVEKQLSLGEKYLSELEYEQAIAAYELAIEIDPKNAEAYIGLADVYIAMGDYEKAEEILEEAKEIITKEEDIDRIKRKEKKVEKKKEEAKAKGENSEPTKAPEASATSEPTPTLTLTEVPVSGSVKNINDASVGDYIIFGTYEQDNDLSNGAEPIEWLVLDKRDGKVLVLSKYALDAKPYNEEYVDVTWETCTLRSWLNNEFYHIAFSNEERTAVVETLVKNSGNPEYGTRGGNDTKDKVFILSFEEATTYFNPDPTDNDPARRAKVTNYVKGQGAIYNIGGEYDSNGLWWLRSLGRDRYFVDCVWNSGSVSHGGGLVNESLRVVRPALWIDYSEQELKPTPTPEPTPTAKPKPTATPAPSTGKVQALKNASVGDYITFGAYEQDNNFGNGAEPIEWLVLDKKDGKALVLSKYGLECKRYNDVEVDVIWENCTLRSWLNDEFYHTAFNKEERSAVVETWIQNKDNPVYGSGGGNDTKDRVFLLSIEEATTYFDPNPEECDPARRAKVTEYAKAQGAWYEENEDSEDYGNGFWWLRTPGGWAEGTRVLSEGHVDRYGNSGRYELHVVRPAVWVAYTEEDKQALPLQPLPYQGEELIVIEPLVKDNTTGSTLWNSFIGTKTVNSKISAIDMASVLSANPVIQFIAGAMEVEPGFLTGFSEEISGFEKGAMYGPMIGSIAFAGYIFELADGADVNAFVETLKSKADPKWNICVAADYTQVGAYGNMVYFLMYPDDMDQIAGEGADVVVDTTVIYPEAVVNSWGETLWEAFETMMNDNPTSTAVDVAFMLSMHESIPFMSGAMEVVPGFIAGFRNDISGFKSGAMFGPMMGSIAFVGYVFELEEGADVNAFMTTLTENSDPRWNICVEAEQTVVGAYNNMVFFLMCPLSNQGE